MARNQHGALLLRRAALGIAGSALMIVDICLKLGGLAKVSGVGPELACRPLNIGAHSLAAKIGVRITNKQT